MRIKNTIILALLTVACFSTQDIAEARCTSKQLNKAEKGFNKYLKFPYLITLKHMSGDVQFEMRSNGVDTKNIFLYNLYSTDSTAQALGLIGHTYYQSINFLLPTRDSSTGVLYSNYCWGAIEESGTFQGLCEVILENQAGSLEEKAGSFTASPQ